MPPLSRWFIKAGFVSLVLGIISELLLARPVGWWSGLPAAALHLGAIHLLTVGWLLQLITGVAFWMFPRHPTKPPRGSEGPGWAALGLLNLGLLIRLVAEPYRMALGGPAWPLAVSAGAQLLAVVLIIRLIWPRVRELRG